MSSDIAAALAQAKALVASLESYDGSEAQHLSLLKQTDRLRTTIEEPYDIIARWLENLSAASSTYVLLRLGALQKLPTEGSVSAASLAEAANVDVSVIARTMRICVANGIGLEVAPGEYRANALAQAFLPMGLGASTCVIVEFTKTWASLPAYAKVHVPSDLYDLRKSPFAFMAGHEGKTYYEVISLDPEERNLWNHMLQNMEKGFPIVDMFPFPSLREKAEAEPERPVIVDVGGGRGQALRAIMEHCGGKFGGKWILQDLPIVIESLKEDEHPDIEPMAYDIFTPQPVKSKFEPP